MVFISLEHFRSATKPDLGVCYDNPQFSSCSDFVPKSFTHPVKSELENHIGLTSPPINETSLESTECFPGYDSKSHFHIDNVLIKLNEIRMEP